VDLGEFSILHRDLSREEQALEAQAADGPLSMEQQARLHAITRVLDEVTDGLDARRRRRAGGPDDPSVVDKYFSHTLKRWPRAGGSPLDLFGRRRRSG